MKALEEAPFYPTPDNPMPSGGHAFFVAPENGIRIRAALWGQGERGTILLLPGRTEVIEKYFETVSELQARGFAILLLDWRGQGASSRMLRNPLKGHIRDFSEYLVDLSATLSAAAGELPRPWLLLGHSMGGNVALRALQDEPSRFAGAVLSAPLTGIRIDAPRIVECFAALMPPGGFVPGGEKFDPFKERFSSNPVTHELRRFARNAEIFKAYPALALGAPTWGWLRAALAASRRVMRRAALKKIAVPVLILSAQIDRLVDISSQRRAAKRLANATYAQIAGARHELLQETDALRAEFWRHFDQFTEALLPRAHAPSSADRNSSP